MLHQTVIVDLGGYFGKNTLTRNELLRSGFQGFMFGGHFFLAHGFLLEILLRFFSSAVRTTRSSALICFSLSSRLVRESIRFMFS